MVTCKLYFPNANSAGNADLNLNKSDLFGVAMTMKGRRTHGDARQTSYFIHSLWPCDS